MPQLVRWAGGLLLVGLVSMTALGCRQGPADSVPGGASMDYPRLFVRPYPRLRAGGSAADAPRVPDGPVHHHRWRTLAWGQRNPAGGCW